MELLPKYWESGQVRNAINTLFRDQNVTVPEHFVEIMGKRAARKGYLQWREVMGDSEAGLRKITESVGLVAGLRRSSRTSAPPVTSIHLRPTHPANL